MMDHAFDCSASTTKAVSVQPFSCLRPLKCFCKAEGTQRSSGSVRAANETSTNGAKSIVMRFGIAIQFQYGSEMPKSNLTATKYDVGTLE